MPPSASSPSDGSTNSSKVVPPPMSGSWAFSPASWYCLGKRSEDAATITAKTASASRRIWAR